MKQLILGKITSKELAEWFGIKYKSYLNNKTKYLQILEDFCDFDAIYGGIEVKEIYLDTYVKNMRQVDNENYCKEIERCAQEQDGLSTVAGMTRKFQYYNVEDYADYSERQVQRKLTKTKTLLFGRPANSIFSIGSIGACEIVWAIKLDNFNNYRHLTEEEQKLFDDLCLEWNGSLDPKDIQKQALLDETFRETDMTKEEYIAARAEIMVNKKDFFEEVIEKFRSQTGYMPVRCSQHKFSAF
jgi:hypothetical protein